MQAHQHMQMIQNPLHIFSCPAQGRLCSNHSGVPPYPILQVRLNRGRREFGGGANEGLDEHMCCICVII